MKGLAISALSFALFVRLGHAQFFGVPTITFDPTQAAHVVQQIAQAEKTYTTTVQTYENVVGAYNLAKRMSTSPQSLYSGYGAGLPSWVPVLPSRDTYGNTGPWLTSVNKAVNSSEAALSSASVARVTQLTGYEKLDSNSQRAVAAQGATIDLRDSVSATNLSAVGTIRSNQAQRQADIANLEAASHTLDSSQQTELATLQRINQALLLLLRTQQDQSQLAQGQTLQQIVTQKQQQDELKLLFLNAQNYEANYNSKVSTSLGSVARAFTY